MHKDLSQTRPTHFGVDFSGARDAGRKIWLASGSVTGETIRLLSLSDLHSCSGAKSERLDAYSRLRRVIREHKNSIFGFDFPFSIPAKALTGTWRDFILTFSNRFPAPDDFRTYCREILGNKEVRRETEQVSRTPFCSYNLRIYKQTYYGITEIISPLVEQDHVSVIPFETPSETKAWLIEVCPASRLKADGIYSHYKGRTVTHRLLRQRILESISTRYGLVVSDRQRETLLSEVEGDALDAVLALISTCRNFDKRLPEKPYSPLDRLEGKVYI